MDNLIFCMNATLPIFFVMAAGYLMQVFGLMDDHFVDILNKFNYKMTLPLLLFFDIYNSDFVEVWDTRFVLFCFFATLICICVIWLLTRIFLRDKMEVGEFTQAAYRGSAAVLGIAFIQNIYGSSTIAPLMIIGTVPLYNIMAVIILTFTGPKGHKPDRAGIQKSLTDIVTNPIILGILMGVFASVLHVKLPFLITKTGSYFYNIATPLALIGLGAGFEGAKALKEVKATLVCSFIKLLVQPALFLPAAIYFGFTGEKMVALLIMLGAPTTVSCYIMARNMEHRGVLTSSVVAASTFLGSFSLTFWLYFLRSRGLI